ncbi:MAG: hypothetical protein ACKVQV_05515, partial [Bacteroidia bacterium]
YIVGVPRWVEDKSIWLYNKHNKTSNYCVVPVEGDYDQVTDCKLTDTKLIFTIEHGESFILNLHDNSFNRFKEEIPWEEEYNGLDIPSSFDIDRNNKIILGVHKSIITFNINGEFESQIEFPDIIHSIRTCDYNNSILVTCVDDLHCIDYVTKNPKFKHKLASSFPKSITCKKNMILIYSGFAGLDGNVELLNATNGNSYFILHSKLLQDIYYDAVISDDGNSLLILHEKRGIVNGKRIHDKRLLTILTRQ